MVYLPTEQLKAQQKAEGIRRRLKTVHMPKSIREASFDQMSFRNDIDGYNHAYMAAMEFAQDYNPGHFERGLYLYGSFGVGKTYMLGAVANRLAERGIATTIVHFPSLAVELRDSIKKGTLGEQRDAIRRVPVLMLDDLGAGSMSSWVRDDVLGVILEYRMQEELPTFFSSNFSMDELEKNYLTIDAQGGTEPMKAKRIMERIRFLSQEYRMVGTNRRRFRMLESLESSPTKLENNRQIRNTRGDNDGWNRYRR